MKNALDGKWARQPRTPRHETKKLYVGKDTKINGDGNANGEVTGQTPSPKDSLRKPAQKKSGVEIRCRALMLSTRQNAFQHPSSTPINTRRQRNSTPRNLITNTIRPNQPPLPFNPPSMR
jgi:hypothetical protein